MTSIGIIGTDNTRTSDLARLCNQARKLPLRVSHLWGEDFAKAEAMAVQRSVPHVVRNWRDLAGAVDGVVVAHRHGAEHYQVAKWFLERGMPVFVDKPLTVSLAEAKKLFVLSEKHRAPLGTCSALVLQRSFRAFLRSLRSLGPIRFLNASGLADIYSPHGGLFFYGIHQVDTIVECLGLEALSVELIPQGKQALGIIRFSGDRLATMNCLADQGAFHWRACGDRAILSYAYEPDAERNLGIARAILGLVKEGKPPASLDRMLAPIAILEALRRSQLSGGSEKVARFQTKR